MKKTVLGSAKTRAGLTKSISSAKNDMRPIFFKLVQLSKTVKSILHKYNTSYISTIYYMFMLKILFMHLSDSLLKYSVLGSNKVV